MWAQFALFVGSLLVSRATRPRTEEVRPPGVDELNFPTATEDRKVPWVAGTVKLSSPNVVWWGDLRLDEVWEHKALAADVRVNQMYAVGMQMALCRGEVDELRKFWVGDQIAWDAGAVSSGASKTTVEVFEPFLFGGCGPGEGGGVVGYLDFYGGARNQAVDAYLLTQQGGTDSTPAYRGNAYVVWRGPSAGKRGLPPNGETEPYTDINGVDHEIGIWRRTASRSRFYRYGFYGTSPQPKPWSFEVARWPNNLSIPSTGHKVPSTANGPIGANPMEVFYEWITDGEIGVGDPSASIDVASFVAAGTTLLGEGNGYNGKIDSETNLEEAWRALERQIDGVVDYNPATSRWEATLIRGGYSIPSLPLLDETNVLRVEEWRKPLFEDVKNQCVVRFEVYDETARNWKATSTNAPDLANYNLQGRFETVERRYPGVRVAAQASDIAHRDLRAVNRPLRIGSLIVDRTAWDWRRGDACRFSWVFPDGTTVTDLPLRVTEVRLGEVDKAEIRLDVVEDVFGYEAAAVDDPPDTGWETPVVVPGAIPTDEDIVMELPRALAVRSEAPESLDRLLVGCRDQDDGASSFPVYTRHSATTPSGSYSVDVEAETTAIGQLNSALSQGTSNPTATPSEDIRVDPGDSTVEEFLSFFDVTLATTPELGRSLYNLVLIDDEILAVTEVEDNTTYVLLKTVYRGFLDTVPSAHSSGAKVFVLRATPGERVYPRTHNVHVQLRPASTYGTLAEGSANTVALTLADRGRAPYPTTALSLNGSVYPSGTVSLDDPTGGSGLDEVGVNVSATLRDRDVYDQVLALSVGLASGDPYDTNIQVRVTKDPSTSPTLLLTTAMVDAVPTSPFPILVSRTEILAANGGVVPSELRVETILEHTVEDPEGGSDITINDLLHDTWEGSVDSSDLSGLDEHGVLDDSDVATFVADASDTYVFTIGSSVLSSGVVEAENATAGGGYSTVIATSGTTGTLAGVTAGDTINFRHTQTGPGTGHTTILIAQQTGSVSEGFGVLRV
jgi:hypothetical protein